MTHEQELVRKFYDVIWNDHNKSAIPDVLHKSFIFRGSLGIDKKGHDEFVEYLDMIHSALANYQCTLIEIVTEDSKVFAKVQFTGTHQGTLMGIESTNQKVSWDGAALFHFKEGKISSLWVLGDLKALENQLSHHSP
jgi:steroid delta-isomerase-like uncharacterized protein